MNDVIVICRWCRRWVRSIKRDIHEDGCLKALQSRVRERYLPELRASCEQALARRLAEWRAIPGKGWPLTHGRAAA